MTLPEPRNLASLWPSWERFKNTLEFSIKIRIFDQFSNHEFRQFWRRKKYFDECFNQAKHQRTDHFWPRSGQWSSNQWKYFQNFRLHSTKRCLCRSADGFGTLAISCAVETFERIRSEEKRTNRRGSFNHGITKGLGWEIPNKINDAFRIRIKSYNITFKS